MLLAQRYVTGQNWSPLLGHALSTGEARSLADCLTADAAALTTCASVSMVDAIRGIELGLFSWATVKLYFSVFYCFRAILAANQYCVCYDGRKPRWFRARTGALCKKLKGNTHEVVMNLFEAELQGHWLLSQEIDLKSPPTWLMGLREEANYRRGEFWEPTCPDHFVAVADLGVRRAVETYVRDKMFAFDKDHAAVAYPLRAIMEARTKVAPMDEGVVTFLKARARDSRGPLPELFRQVTGA